MRSGEEVLAMEKRKIVVVVEEVEAAKTGLLWALNNLIRYGDSIILLHVFSFPITTSSSCSNITNKLKKQRRVLRLKGFHLALSFKHLCDITFPHAEVEIVVTQGDQDGDTIASMVRDIGASALVVGLHDHSFLYKMAAKRNRVMDNPNCRILAIKQSSSCQDCNSNLDFSQIETAKLRPPAAPQQKIRYQILPSPFGIMWKGSKRR